MKFYILLCFLKFLNWLLARFKPGGGGGGGSRLNRTKWFYVMNGKWINSTIYIKLLRLPNKGIFITNLGNYM